ncbi:MAG: dihydroorotate dehydrogenase-like protein [Propionicimonas sp.]|uniref:dihydroorotate dehydrogenase-like protein n=1 Tax=Propionicimonas sp. TaxID=1955623 RepID=UPI003D0E57EA
MRPQLATTYLGLPLSGPVIASACPLTGRLDALLELEAAGASAVVLPSLFEEEVLAEEGRLADLLGTGDDFVEFSGAPLPDMDQPDLGAGRFVGLLRKAKQQLRIPVIASLNATRPGSWQRYAAELADAGADALELNLYTMSTDPGVSSSDLELAHLAAIEAVKIAVDIPLSVKLSPYYAAMSTFCAQAVDAGADGLVLFNRFYAPDIDLERLALLARADLSEPDDQRIVLRWLGILRGQLPETSLACTSGVHSGAEVLKALLVGADVACTASAILRRGPEAITLMLAEVEAWLTVHEYESIAQLRGSMSAASVPDTSAYERAQYAAVLHSGNYA